MPLYLIEEKAAAAEEGKAAPEPKRRLIEAQSEVAAIKHYAAELFTTRIVKTTTEVAKLAKDGVAIENAE